MSYQQKPLIVRMVFSWWSLLGGLGTAVAIIALMWDGWAHFDKKAHDKEMVKLQREAAEAGKSDLTINVDLPDINADKTIKAISDGASNLTSAAGEVATDLGEKAVKTRDDLLSAASAGKEKTLKTVTGWTTGITQGSWPSWGSKGECDDPQDGQDP